MNAIRIRVVILDGKFWAGPGYKYAVQLSEHGLIWWTIMRKETEHEAKAFAEELSAFMRTSRLAKADKVIWEEIL